MKKCVIYVFSGTGNTRLIAELYKKYLSDYETTIYNVEMEKSEDGVLRFTAFPDPAEFDLIGLGHPVHGFNAPKIMWDFCKKLPVLKEKKNVFILRSSGEGLRLNDFSTQKIVRLLSRRNYNFINERRYVMPYNMIFRHSPEMVKSEYIFAEKYVQHTCKKIQDGAIEKVHYCNAGSFFVPIVRILWIYARVQSPFMKINMDKCIKCQKCVNNCPYHNISFNEEKNKFKFGTDCVLCVRCSFNCPTDAFNLGLLNNWRINGDYKIKAAAENEELEFPYFTAKNLHGIKRFAYLKYFERLEKILKE